MLVCPFCSNKVKLDFDVTIKRSTDGDSKIRTFRWILLGLRGMMN